MKWSQWNEIKIGHFMFTGPNLVIHIEQFVHRQSLSGLIKALLHDYFTHPRPSKLFPSLKKMVSSSVVTQCLSLRHKIKTFVVKCFTQKYPGAN